MRMAQPSGTSLSSGELAFDLRRIIGAEIFIRLGLPPLLTVESTPSQAPTRDRSPLGAHPWLTTCSQTGVTHTTTPNIGGQRSHSTSYLPVPCKVGSTVTAGDLQLARAVLRLPLISLTP